MATLLDMVRDVIVNRLSGQYLKKRTGGAQRSVAASPSAVVAGNVVRGQFGSSLLYVRAHEEGFEGIVGVRAHTRRVRSRDVRARVAGRRRRVATGVAFVRAHTRKMSLRARRFLADTLQQRIAGLDPRMVRAILILAQTGRIPVPGQLLAVGA